MLNYGDQIMLQNAYNNWEGGFLDTCNQAAAPEMYDVFTSPSAPSPRVAGTNTGLWKILDANGNATGQPVHYGDQIILQNGYNNWEGGFLDTCNQAAAPELYDVFTSPGAPSPRGAGTNTALWKILDASGNATGQPVNPGDSVILQNGYNNWGGGFLDTCNQAAAPELYGVFTSPSAPNPRGAGVNTALWRILR